MHVGRSTAQTCMILPRLANHPLVDVQAPACPSAHQPTPSCLFLRAGQPAGRPAAHAHPLGPDLQVARHGVRGGRRLLGCAERKHPTCHADGLARACWGGQAAHPSRLSAASCLLTTPSFCSFVLPGDTYRLLPTPVDALPPPPCSLLLPCGRHHDWRHHHCGGLRLRLPAGQLVLLLLLLLLECCFFCTPPCLCMHALLGRRFLHPPCLCTPAAYGEQLHHRHTGHMGLACFSCTFN